jgi:hypothetical protein
MGSSGSSSSGMGSSKKGSQSSGGKQGTMQGQATR